MNLLYGILSILLLAQFIGLVVLSSCFNKNNCDTNLDQNVRNIVWYTISSYYIILILLLLTTLFSFLDKLNWGDQISINEWQSIIVRILLIGLSLAGLTKYKKCFDKKNCNTLPDSEKGYITFSLVVLWLLFLIESYYLYKSYNDKHQDDKHQDDYSEM